MSRPVWCGGSHTTRISPIDRWATAARFTVSTTRWRPNYLVMSGASQLPRHPQGYPQHSNIDPRAIHHLINNAGLSAATLSPFPFQSSIQLPLSAGIHRGSRRQASLPCAPGASAGAAVSKPRVRKAQSRSRSLILASFAQTRARFYATV